MIRFNELLIQHFLTMATTEKEKFFLLSLYKVNSNVKKYLRCKFESLEIVIPDDCRGKFLKLMRTDHLLGWCWQSTNTASLFMENDDFIERGNLVIESPHRYYHSWIVFQYENVSYVFDPALNVLCEHDLYFQMFTPEVFAQVASIDVKNYFFEKVYESSEKEILISGSQDIFSPFYLGKVTYTPSIEENKIKYLIANYGKRRT